MQEVTEVSGKLLEEAADDSASPAALRATDIIRLFQEVTNVLTCRIRRAQIRIRKRPSP